MEVLQTSIYLINEDVAWCPGGAISDSSTYAQDPGHTTFTGVRRGGIAWGTPCAGATISVAYLGIFIEEGIPFP